MKIAIVGATSQIASDLILSMSIYSSYDLLLYARDTHRVDEWLRANKLTESYQVFDLYSYGEHSHDIVINFIGVGDPARAAEMGESIFDITLHYDQMILAKLQDNPERQYIFISSGAVYGSDFEMPASLKTRATININSFTPTEYYSLAKLYAEGRHRALPNYNIVDVRVFNYLSNSLSMDARFFIADIVRSVRDRKPFLTSNDAMVRDYLHPKDFFQLIHKIIASSHINKAIDCFSKKPISKKEVLNLFKSEFGLKVKLSSSPWHINATGSKPNYFSVNYKASELGYLPQYSSEECLLEFGMSLLNIKSSR